MWYIVIDCLLFLYELIIFSLQLTIISDLPQNYGTKNYVINFF